MTAVSAAATGRLPGPRSVSDEEARYVSYRLGNNEFRQYPDVLCGVAPAKGEQPAEPYPILSGRLAVDEVAELRDLLPNLTLSGRVLDTVISATYTPISGGTRSTRVVSSDMESRDPQWPLELGIAARTNKTKIVGNAVRAMAARVEYERGWQQAVATSGMILRDGVPAFLRPGLPALTSKGTDPGLYCELDPRIADQPGVRVLGLDDPSTPEQAGEDLAALLGFLDVVPDQPAVPLAMLAQLAWAPFAALPDLGQVCVVVAGDSGRRKTALAGVVIAAQSRTYVGGRGVEVPVTAKMRGNQSTVFGVDQLLHALGGKVAVVDDYFAGKMSAKEAADGWKRLSLLGDNAVTGSGGTRGGYRNGRGTVASAAYPRACILATAEDLPDEAEHGSEVARYVALRLERDIDSERLSEVQESARSLSRAHAAMVQAGLGDLDMPRRTLRWADEAIEGWGFAGHNRVRYGYSKLLAGVGLLGEALRRNGLECQTFLNDASELLREAAADQSRRCGMRNGQQLARDPVRLFAKHFRLAIAGDPWWLAAPQMGTAGEFGGGLMQWCPPVLPDHGPSAVGWRQTGQTGGWTPAGRGEPLGAVYAATGTGRPPWREVALRLPCGRWDEVCAEIGKRVREEGWSLPAPDVMRLKLTAAGVMRSAQGESMPVWESGRKRSCLVLDLGSLLAGLDEEDQEEPEAGPEGSGGPGPVPPLPAAPEPVQLDLGGQARDDDGQEDEEDAGGSRGTSAGLGIKPERGLGRVGVLDVDGLHVAGRSEVVPVALPAGLAGAYEVAESASVSQLWVHPRAVLAMGLPAERPANVVIDAGLPHEWAELDGTGLECDPKGLAPWVVVWKSSGARRESSRSIVFPGYDSRTPWVDAEDGATLLEAVTTLNRQLGKVDYYRSPNTTIGQFVLRHTRSADPCRAILSGEVPPAVRHAQMVPVRSSRGLLDEEEGTRFLHRFDLSAAELTGMNTPLGVGEPKHRMAPEGQGLEFEKAERKLAGYWRLAEAPGVWDTRLPDLVFRPSEDGSVWVTTPDLVLLGELAERYGQSVPVAVEAWVWPESKRALYATYERLQQARKALILGRGTPGGEIAYKAHSGLYKTLMGYLARVAGPRDEKDALWRPDWRDMIKAQTYCNAYRQMVRVGHSVNRWPVATYADAVYYAADELEAAGAAPAGLVLGTGGGQWKHEAVVPLAAVEELVGERRFHAAYERESQKGVKA